MRSGDLTHRLVLQRGTESRDSFGEPIATWTNLATVWAQVEYVAGSEGFDADRDRTEVPATIRLRRSSDTMSLRAKDRALVPTSATTLRNALTSSTGTALVLEEPGVCPPDADFVLRIGQELVQVTAGAGTVASPYTITRGAYGTTAKRQQAGTSAQVMVHMDIESVVQHQHSIELTAVRSEERVP